MRNSRGIVNLFRHLFRQTLDLFRQTRCRVRKVGANDIPPARGAEEQETDPQDGLEQIRVLENSVRVIGNEECEMTEGAPAWPLNQFVCMLVEKFRKLE